MKFIKYLIVLFVFIFIIEEADAKLYTITQAINVPGQASCQLIFVSIFDDMGTADNSDDKHLKTDAFMRCGAIIKPSEGNLNAPNDDESYMTSIIPGHCAGVVSSLVRTSDTIYQTELNYLNLIANAYDEYGTTKDVYPIYELIDKAPEYFQPYLIKGSNEFEWEEYLNKIKKE